MCLRCCVWWCAFLSLIKNWHRAWAKGSSHFLQGRSAAQSSRYSTTSRSVHWRMAGGSASIGGRADSALRAGDVAAVVD